MKKRITIATAPTLERLEKLINEFYCTDTCSIVDESKVINSKGEIKAVEVVKIKGRFIFRFKDSPF